MHVRTYYLPSTYLPTDRPTYLPTYQCGVGVPAAFSYVKTAPASPLYPRALGLVLVGCYALLLGGGGTLAEPAMLVFADTVDGPGAVERSPLRRNLLIATTAAGVAVRASPLGLALASSPLERTADFEHLAPYGCSLELPKVAASFTVAGGVAALAPQAASTPAIPRSAAAARRRRGRAEHAGAPSKPRPAS